MKTWIVEQDWKVLATETHYYMVAADTLEDAISMVDNGELEPSYTKRHDGGDLELLGYEDSRELTENS